MTVREWINLWNGRAIDEDGAYGAQCWDLAQKYVREIIGCPRLPTRPGGNGFAKDCFEQFLAPLPQYFDRIQNNPSNPNQVPLPGDVIVWGDGIGQGGHIAIVVEAKVGSSTVKVFQQNAPMGSPPVIGNLSYKFCLGWLAPKVRPQFDKPAPAPSQPQPATPSMPSGEFYNVQSGNTFWGLEEVWGLSHGTLQSLNPAQDPRQLRVGQAIRIRPAAPVATPPPAPVPDEFRTIAPGDTFWDLENKLGLSHGTLQSLNPEQNPRTLQIGQRIRVKAAVPAPVAPTPPPASAAVQDDSAVQKAQSASTDVATPAPAEPSPEPAPQPDLAQVVDTAVTLGQEIEKRKLNVPEPSFWAKHFNKQKILLDLAALGTAAGGVVSWVMGHHEVMSAALQILAGIIFGGNRMNRK